MPSTKKSVGKSAVPPQLKPFQRGNDPRRGRGPEKGAPNAGRPPDRIKELAESGLEVAVWAAIEIVHGEPTEKVKLGGADGKTIEVIRSADANARIRAGEFLGKVSHRIGHRLEVEHTQQKPLVVIVRQELKNDRGDE